MLGGVSRGGRKVGAYQLNCRRGLTGLLAEELGLPEYRRLQLRSEFEEALLVMRYCLEIRNQYAHWVWWDDSSGKLAFANVEDLTRHASKVTGFGKLKAHHVDAALLKAQEACFVYADDLLLWVNYEGRFKDGKLGKATQNPVGDKPKKVKEPPLHL